MRGYNDQLGVYELAKDVSDSLHEGVQNERILITGEIGSGKSFVAMVLAQGIACWESIKKYKMPIHWHEFWNPETDMAIIDAHKAMEVMANTTQDFHVAVLDDAAIDAWNSRTYQTKRNKGLNALIQSNRPFRTVLIVTTQLGSFIDSQARSMFNRFVEVSGPHCFEIAVNFVKGMIVKLRPRAKEADKLRYLHVRMAGYVWDILACGAPDDELVDAYGKVRKAEAMKIAERARHKQEDVPKEKRKPKSNDIREYASVKRPPKNRKLRAAYVTGLAKDLECTPRHVSDVLHRYGL